MISATIIDVRPRLTAEMKIIQLTRRRVACFTAAARQQG